MKTLLIFTIFCSCLASAKSLEEVQLQADQLLASSNFSSINRSLNKSCRQTLEENKRGVVFSLSGNRFLENFAEVVPGIYRFSVPTKSTLLELNETGLCQRVITLNGDCVVSRFDRGDYQQTLNALVSHGFEKRKAQAMMAFYRDHKDVCQSAELNPWHQWLQVYSATNSISEIFKALELVRVSRAQGETVCFHCHAGKHRTGLLAMLVKILDGEELEEIFLDYTLHTWNGICISKEEVKAIIPLLTQSEEFLRIKSLWIK